MSTRIRGWILSIFIIAITTAASFFIGNTIQENTILVSTEAPTGESEVPESTENTEPVAEGTTAVSDESTVPAETSETTSETYTHPAFNYKEIRELTEAEMEIIEKRYDSTLKLYTVSSEKNDQNISIDVINAYSDIVSKFVYVHVYGDTATKTCSLFFVLTEENGNTEKILDILKERGVKATFFISGSYITDNPTIMERIILEGHELGSLGASNPPQGLAQTSSWDIHNDIINLHNMVKPTYDYTMKKFMYDRNYYTDKALGIATQMGYEVYFYSVDYADADPEVMLDSNVFLNKMTQSLHKGAIYKFHTTNDATVRMLPGLLDYFTQQSYEVVLLK